MRASNRYGWERSLVSPYTISYSIPNLLDIIEAISFKARTRWDATSHDRMAKLHPELDSVRCAGQGKPVQSDLVHYCSGRLENGVP
jgi:hypothetical protein